jgi:uncharacterized protein
MPPVLTGLYAIPLAVLMIALSTHVTLLRASTGISILDGGNKQLAERIRRHGNFAETVPMVLLLMLISELLGATPIWLHAIGILLLVGRLFHPIGLRHDNPRAVPRILGGVATTAATLIAVICILMRTFAK